MDIKRVSGKGVLGTDGHLDVLMGTMGKRRHVGWVAVLLQDAVASIYCYVFGKRMYSDNIILRERS